MRFKEEKTLNGQLWIPFNSFPQTQWSEISYIPVSVIGRYLLTYYYFSLCICCQKYMKRMMGGICSTWACILCSSNLLSWLGTSKLWCNLHILQLHRYLFAHLSFVTLFICSHIFFPFPCIHLCNDIHTEKEKKECHCTTWLLFLLCKWLWIFWLFDTFWFRLCLTCEMLAAHPFKMEPL